MRHSTIRRLPGPYSAGVQAEREHQSRSRGALAAVVTRAHVHGIESARAAPAMRCSCPPLTFPVLGPGRRDWRGIRGAAGAERNGAASGHAGDGAREPNSGGGRRTGAAGRQDARLNAETLAGAAGATLGPVRTLNGSASPPMVPMYRQRVAMADAAMAPEASYQAGEMRFTASVNAEYDLLVKP